MNNITVYYVAKHNQNEIDLFFSLESFEKGIITSVGEKYIFVRYFNKDGTLQTTPKATDPNDLFDEYGSNIINCEQIFKKIIKKCI